MNGIKTIERIEQSYPPNGERSGKQDRRRQDKTDSSSDIPDGRQLESFEGTQGDHREAFEAGRDRSWISFLHWRSLHRQEREWLNSLTQ